MALYSLALLAGLAVSAPWWLLRMAGTQRYREGLRQRLGGVPESLRGYIAGRSVVWVHAVSVGEVLAAGRLVTELEAALGSRWGVVVSTTTRTGQALARRRFGPDRVFYMPLDLAFAVRAYLRALKPAAVVLMESELWPRLLHECGHRGVPVAVANARVSDRSYRRALKLRPLWRRVLRGVTLWLAQSEDDARRLLAMGAQNVQVSGNLKYDVRAAQQSRIAGCIRELAAGRPVLVAGSTVDRLTQNSPSEDEMVIEAWEAGPRHAHVLLVLAARHPERFREVEAAASRFRFVKASSWEKLDGPIATDGPPVEIVLLDTIGDLASVYGIADVAFVGGSLVARGGHNPLEPAQFGVPVVMGPHYENFRNVVETMRAAEAIRIVADNHLLKEALVEMFTDRAAARALGERGRQVFETQQGATLKTVEALQAMLSSRERAGSKAREC